MFAGIKFQRVVCCTLCGKTVEQEVFCSDDCSQNWLAVKPPNVPEKSGQFRTNFRYKWYKIKTEFMGYGELAPEMDPE